MRRERRSGMTLPALFTQFRSIPMPVKQLSDGNPDGTVLGQSSGDSISFYNVAPVQQRSGAAQAAVDTTAPTNASPFGFTQTQAQAIVTLLNEIRATLVAVGLMKGQ
jgi:hypothetical protein